MSLSRNANSPDHFWYTGLLRCIIRLAFYFSVPFLTGCIFGALRVNYVVPILHFDRSKAEICEMPFMLVAVAVWARFIMVRYKVPKFPGTRLAISLVALGFMVLVELVGQWIMYRRRDKETVWSKDDGAAHRVFAAALVAFGLMPWLLMVIGTDVETAHISKGIKNNI